MQYLNNQIKNMRHSSSKDGLLGAVDETQLKVQMLTRQSSRNRLIISVKQISNENNDKNDSKDGSFSSQKSENFKSSFI